MTKNFKIWIHSLVIMGVFLMFASSCKKGDESSNPASSGTVTDIEGNVYHTVTIGTQTWMVENLKTTKYKDGTPIPTTIDNAAWTALTTGACGVTNLSNDLSNDSNIPTNLATYGRLYNWYAVNTGKLAPSGWHVPTDDEWSKLTTFLGGQSIAGGKLKEVGFTHWLEPGDQGPNNIATNETGFTALPGGERDKDDGSYQYVMYFGYWWSSTEDLPNNSAWGRSMDYDSNNAVRYNPLSKRSGFSVRCIKD